MIGSGTEGLTRVSGLGCLLRGITGTGTAAGMPCCPHPGLGRLPGKPAGGGTLHGESALSCFQYDHTRGSFVFPTEPHLSLCLVSKREPFFSNHSAVHLFQKRHPEARSTPGLIQESNPGGISFSNHTTVILFPTHLPELFLVSNPGAVTSAGRQ